MHLWGYLVPHTQDHRRIDLCTLKGPIRIGRSLRNDIVIALSDLDLTHFAILQAKGSVYLVALQGEEYVTTVSGIQMPAGNVHVLTDGRQFAAGKTTNAINFTYRNYDINKVNIDYEYHIGEILGSGAFGMVRYAVHRSSGTEHAVKTIMRSSYPSVYYDREITIMKSISHPNIIQVREVFEEGRKIHLVMELVVNGNLMDYIEMMGSILEYKAKQASWDICNGMKYLHSCGIVHRDLKPENVLVVSVAPIMVKIADFGLAKMYHEGTVLRSICGTPNHMAPEVWLTTEIPDYGLAVDSWSMGVMAFIMLSCYFPFLYDDDEILDIDDFYRRRQIQWQALPEETSWRARDFIQRLLVHTANERLLLQVALDHIWFLDLVPRRTSAQTITSTSTREVEEVRRILEDVPT